MHLCEVVSYADMFTDYQEDIFWQGRRHPGLLRTP